MQTAICSALSIVHPIELIKGQNAHVWDVSGKQYIDFVGGIGVLNLGHCHPRIVAAIQNQASQLIHSAFNAVPHQPYMQLAQALSNFIPSKTPFDVLLANSGAEATENALKIARLKTGRTGVIAFDGGFHGRTLAAVNLNGKVAAYKTKLGSLPGPVYHIPYPSEDNGITAAQAKIALERVLSVEVDINNIAAIIVEPIIGEGGFQLLNPEFAVYLRRFCDENGIALIFDEVQSGFGRSGKRFAFEHLNVAPDLLLMGKSIAGGVPLGAVAGDVKWMGDLPKGSLGGTYSGNPLACAAALATIDIMSQEDFFAQVAHNYSEVVSAYHQKWQEQGLPVGRLTGVGSMRGIELVDAEGQPDTDLLAKILPAAREQGLLLMPSGKYRNVIRLLPPLTIETDVLVEGLELLGRLLAEQTVATLA
ncbi:MULTISPECIES: 2-aminoadipate transaminase [Vitreoscilla]|uniref:Aspartate aminotransferase family protein n=1 Tax=Vitreoscilla stercoraria TaxID=61 RepID=A0ABY4ECK8_VITST|nr:MULTISPECIES: aspartate aminotransferase family protein [Vitreoscilla]AUZ05971.1 class 3 aminotransferase [Vitreoscilla sp. C1]UOO92655.1 aspartate aminotransferase family protein [Vitreoscilla stercoraria]